MFVKAIYLWNSLLLPGKCILIEQQWGEIGQNKWREPPSFLLKNTSLRKGVIWWSRKNAEVGLRRCGSQIFSATDWLAKI